MNVRQPPKRRAEAIGLPNYEPPAKQKLVDAEAVADVYRLKNERNIGAQELEGMKVNTLPLRRKMILSANVSFEDLLEKFPWLFQEEEVRIPKNVSNLTIGRFSCFATFAIGGGGRKGGGCATPSPRIS